MMRPFSNILDSCLKGPIRNIVLQASQQQSMWPAGISIDYEAHPSADALFLSKVSILLHDAVHAKVASVPLAGRC